MEIGISTCFFHERSVFESLPDIKEAGIKYLELWTFSGLLDVYKHFDPSETGKVEGLKKMLDEMMLKAVSIHAPFNHDIDISAPDETARQAAVRLALFSAEALNRISGDSYSGTKTVVVHPSSVPLKHNEDNMRFDRARKSILEIVEKIRPPGVKLALENQLPHIFGNNPETLLALLEGIPEEDCGVCFDVSHACLHKNILIEEMLDKFRGRVLTLHVSDSDFQHDNHFPLGEGKINWPNFINRLKSTGYEGIFVNEILREVPGKDRAETMKIIKERELKLL